VDLTPDILRAAYEYLAETGPFSRWNLPHAEDVRFQVTRSNNVHGSCSPPCERRPHYVFALSARRHSHTSSIMVTMAHEMVHAHMFESRLGDWRAHGDTFNALAKEVCDAHGFDPGQF
jgi:hypothetical protein